MARKKKKPPGKIRTTPEAIRCGALIRAARESAGKTIAAAAEAAGVHKVHWSHMEHGRREPKWSTLVAVAAALGVEPSSLFEPPDRQDQGREASP